MSNTTRGVADWWHQAGFSLYRTGPAGLKWGSSIAHSNKPASFQEGDIIYVHCGVRSNGLLVVRVPAEQVELAERILPPTLLRSGTAKYPANSFWYRLKNGFLSLDEIPNRRFIRKDRTVAVALFGDKSLIQVYPEQYRDGDTLVWLPQSNALPSFADEFDLLRRVETFCARIGCLKNRLLPPEADINPVDYWTAPSNQFMERSICRRDDDDPNGAIAYEVKEVAAQRNEDRGQRLREVVAWAANSLGVEQDELTKHIRVVHDWKGCLSVFWRRLPPESWAWAFGYAWDQAAECRHNVEHYLWDLSNQFEVQYPAKKTQPGPTVKMTS